MKTTKTNHLTMNGTTAEVDGNGTMTYQEAGKPEVYVEEAGWGALQTLPSELLEQVARGEVDLNKVAIWLLAHRGQDHNGTWVGFDKAKKQFGVK